MASRMSVRVAVGLGIVVAGYFMTAAATEQSASKMAQAAQAFLGSLTPEQRQQALFEFASSERQRWNFIPNEMFPRKGLAFRTMTAAQRERAHALLKTGLSQKGYATASAIIELEDVLRAIEASENNTRFARSPLDYQFTIFGTPGPTGSWAWRVEGHHLSLHFAVRGGKVESDSPTFTGSNPAEVKDGPKKGLRVLAPLEDLGRAVVDGLSEAQRTTAVVAAAAPNDIVTGNKNDIAPLTPPGIALAQLSAAQRDGVMRLVQAYTSLMADDLAAERTNRLKAAGLDGITFAWSGPTAKGQKHYYRVQGPTFLIEYDNSQNDGNHIHAVWRDFQGDFGRDVLREHLARDHAR